VEVRQNDHYERSLSLSLSLWRLIFSPVEAAPETFICVLCSWLG